MNLIDLLTSPRGRISRMQFWIGCAILAALSPLLALAIEAWRYNTWTPRWSFEVEKDAVFIFAVISFAVGAKRFHDVGKSAWYHLLWLIPIVGQLWWIIELGFFPGEPGPNKYGPGPNERPA